MTPSITSFVTSFVGVLRVVGVVVVLGGVACSDTTLPANLLLSCDSDAECPDNLVCEPASRRCVPALAGDALTVTATVDQTRVGRPLIGAPVTMTLTFSAAPADTPRVHLASDSDSLPDAVVDAGDDAASFVATFAFAGDEADGVYRVVVDAVDARGLPQQFVTDTVVTADFTLPTAVAVSLQRLPDPRRTPVAFDILDETVLGPAIDVRVVFSPSEAIFLDGDEADVRDDPEHFVAAGDAAAPVVAGGVAGGVDNDLVFVRDTTSANPLIFDVDWTAGASEGAHVVVARLTDLAGNAADVVLDLDGEGASGAVVVDSVAPAAAAVDVAERIVFARAPWGRLDAPARDVFRLTGTDNAVEAGGRLLISRDEAGRVELGRAVADENGAFSAPPADPLDPESVGFPTGDLATLFVRVADGAGNVSAAVAVRDIRWVVTPFDKVVGDVVRNPHRFDEVGIFGRVFTQQGIERGADDGVAGDDDDGLVTVGAGSWRRIALDDPQSLAPFTFGDRSRGSVHSALATDPVHGLTLLFGGTNIGESPGPAGFFGEGFCSQQTADAFVRGADDRWRRRVEDPLLPSPTTSRPTALANVPPLARLFLLLENGETWTFDGTTWRQVCAANGCVDAAAPMQGRVVALVWDARRQVLVASLGGFNGAELFEFAPLDDAPRWQRRVSGDFGEGLGYSDSLGVVALSTSGFFAWDGAVASALCVDAACTATAPVLGVGVRFAYDRAHDNFVVFGGSGPVVCNDNAAHDIAASNGQAPPPDPSPTTTHLFDGTRWTTPTPAVSPPGRSGHAMAWDEVRERVLLVGGDDCDCLGGAAPNMTPGLPNDTWEWDGVTWEQVGTPRRATGFVRENPPPLRDHQMVEAPRQGGVMVLGPQAQSLHVTDGDAWFVARNDNGIIGERLANFATSPSGDIFGFGGGSVSSPGVLGNNGPPFLAQIAANTVDVACTGNPGEIPRCAPPFGTRRFGAAAFHDGDHFWIFGGNDSLSVAPESGPLGRDVAADRATNELWSWSPTDGWQQHCTSGECGAVPAARVLHRGVVDENGNLVVFGGLVDDVNTSNETWSFDGAAWSLIDSADTPPAREGHAMAFDAGRGVTVVAFGTDLGGGRFFAGAPFADPSTLIPHAIPAALSEVWELSGDGWQLAPTSDPEGDGNPEPRSSVVAAGLQGGGVVLMGGTLSPAVTYGDFADFDPNESTTTPRSDDSWVWQGGVDDRPAHRFQVNARRDISLLDGDDEVTGLDIVWHADAARTDSNVAAAVDLFFWDGDGWRKVADLVDCGAGCVSALLSADDAGRALQGPNATLNLAVAPRTTNGAGPGRIALRTDAVEVALRWRRP